MRLGCLLPLASIALVCFGAQGLYTVATNRKPVEISIQDFQKQASPGDKKWLKITGGELDTLNSVYNSGSGNEDAKEIYVPVVAPGEDSTKTPIRLLLLTKDPELVSFINEGRKIDESSPTKALEFAAKNASKLRPKRDIEGLVEFGLDSDDKKRAKIDKLYTNMDPKAIILKDGDKPSLGKAGIMMGIGLVLGFFSLRGFVKKPGQAV